MKSNLFKELSSAVNEKDVENVYRRLITNYLTSKSKKVETLEILSPFGVDGLLSYKNDKSDKLKCLLEFKYNVDLTNKLEQVNILIQCLYYLKKFELAGKKLPSTIFVGDINESFVIHTNSLQRYLSYDIDWKIAPSEAHKKNTKLIQDMMDDKNINPFVFKDDYFEIDIIIDKVINETKETKEKIRLTNHNITGIFEYFKDNILDKCKLNINEQANLFIQIIINPDENYLHPKKKNVLMSKSYGEISVKSQQFESFFDFFEGDIYSPKEKEQFTSIIDRLIEDETRRAKGEFFTPTEFVDLAHKYISDTFGEDWKERFVVWDSAWGTGNLTRDYNFKELYCSTLEGSDIDTANQMGYNSNATKFQFDFLNDSDDKLPKGLLEAINSGKEILFLINPPYGTAGNNKKDSDSKDGLAKTMINNLMLNEDWGSSSQNLYAQFLYRITNYQILNKNIKLCLFSPPLFLSGESYKKFRFKFLNQFNFLSGFLFEACHFSDVAKGWGITFSIFDYTVNKNKFIFDLIVKNEENFELNSIGKKEIYNTDGLTTANYWVKLPIKKYKTKKPPFALSSFITVKDSRRGTEIDNALGYMMCIGNNVKENVSSVAIYSHTTTKECFAITIDNFIRVNSLFVARKSFMNDWINDKDEYLAPNEQHPEYEQFTYDSIIYSLFNNSSQQSSLRQVEYKDKLWDIKNEFFWLSKEEMLNLANENKYDELYKDAKNCNQNRFVYNKLFKDGIYEKLSPDAKKVLDMATELLKQSIQSRKIISQAHPEYHLDSFDAGYAQLKLVWNEYYKDEFKEFRNEYKKFEDRLRPLVYELGFLRK